MQASKSIAASVAGWLELAITDRVLKKVASGLMATIKIESGDDSWYLNVNSEGWGLASKSEAASDVIVRASGDTWEKLLDTDPVEPGWQSFGAIIRQNSLFSIDGEPLRIAHLLPSLERLIELAHLNKQKFTGVAPVRDLSQVTGKYTTHDEAYSPISPVYWEEAGQGIPLVMLHTAGADARQFRHQLADVEVAKAWKMYAFDMPGHGRSGMPAGWSQGDEYVLTQEAYLDQCIKFIEKVVKTPAVIMGCSMGAAMSLVLAARRPDLVLGVVALEAPWRAPGRRSSLLADMRINAGLHNPSYVRALLSPSSLQSYRDEACWIYSQAGFGIYSGDLEFYSNEFDGEIVGKELAKTDVPVYLLTGSYDYSASPENTRKLASLVPQAEFVEMENLGHFPMSENPDGFRKYWVQALDEMQAQLR
ncbi:alpha/beta fold hydrolase [Allopusillimonas ginsengisoli]|uniref:alpha/beta fold hydrolase n=1 Tax=Allopusillimonas ginsengisoli TaxID=453575 RepID=UPI001020A480|nr:alpha/beta hydrolase [Allopusillimonas ginsengisoli]TEA76936.1 alpha/beta hydrolase [Allopusillimonas ginsengisoli]